MGLELASQSERLGRFVHFDDVFGAMVTVFEVLTLEGWQDIIYTFVT